MPVIGQLLFMKYSDWLVSQFILRNYQSFFPIPYKKVLLCFICLILYYPNERVMVLMNGTQLVLPIGFPLGKVKKFWTSRPLFFMEK